MSDNWVVQNLQNALTTWNEKLAEIWVLLTEEPEYFRGGDIWKVIVDIHGALQAIGIALLVLFFLAGMVKESGSFAEVKRPEQAVKVFIRFIIAKAVVTYGLEIMLAIFEILQGIVGTIMRTAAFGWEIPTYVHCSPVMRDAQNKMSKRHGDPSYEDLKAEGYLTEAILNYVALLGWSPKGDLAEQEIFALPELVKAFDIAGISKSPAIFDRAKLDHFNAVYLRAMVPEDFAKVAEPYIRQTVKGDFDIAAIAGLLQARCERLSDIPEKVDFFDVCPEYDVEFFTNKKAKTNPEVCKAMLEAAIPMLESLPTWTVETVHDGLISLAEKLEVKNAKLMWPVRIAAAGKLVTPGGAVEICAILGKEETLRRLRSGLEKLN